MIGLGEKEPKVRKAAGLIVTHAVKIRKQDVKSALHVEDQAEKSVQNTLRVALPQEHAEKEANGVKNLRKEKKDEQQTYKNIS